MQFTFLGTGTSQGVPVIGCNCTICQSKDPKDQRLRTAGLFRNSDTGILIDAGPDLRQQMLRAKVQHLDAICLTHEHNDHIIGMDDVRPFNFSSGKSMAVYAADRVQQDLKHRFAYIFEHNPYPGAPRLELHSIHKGEPFYVNDIKMIPIEVWHGRMPVLGFRIGNCTYITDAKTIAAKELEKVKGTDILILNALHHSTHHSHLNLEEALELIAIINPKQAYLTHISHRMGLTSEVNPRLPANVQLAYDGLTFDVHL